MSLRELLNRRLETDRDRRIALIAACALACVAAVALYLVGGPNDGEPRQTAPTGQIATTAPRDPGANLPSPRPAGAEFARNYLRYLDGANLSILAGAGVRARRTARSVGQIPDEVRRGPLQLLGLTSKPTSDRQAAVTARVADRRHTYTFTAGLTYDSGRWRVIDLVPPDIITVIASARPAREAKAPGGARSAAKQFAGDYVDWVDLVTRRKPAGTAALRRQLERRQHPLARATPTRERSMVRSVQLGPRQGTVISASARVATGNQTLEFSFLMQKEGRRWQVSGFID